TSEMLALLVACLLFSPVLSIGWPPVERVPEFEAARIDCSKRCVRPDGHMEEYDHCFKFIERREESYTCDDVKPFVFQYLVYTEPICDGRNTYLFTSDFEITLRGEKTSRNETSTPEFTDCLKKCGSPYVNNCTADQKPSVVYELFGENAELITLSGCESPSRSSRLQTKLR
ncbi:hypothetical protein PMAYCL1PPCAC_22937, partial [Pristionchus mayeri]